MRICHASIDENGHATGGQAGDQTSKEVCVRSWYNKPWGAMLRYPDAEVARRAAGIAEVLANSNLVGYDQNQRNSLHDELKQYDYLIGRFLFNNRKCETDCSAFVTVCYLCAGVHKLEYASNAPTTRTMEKVFKAAGFEIHLDTKYLTDTKYLLKGDILLKAGSHTAIVIDNGNTPSDNEFYSKYMGDSASIVVALQELGIPHDINHRRKIADANRILHYMGTAEQNTKMLELLKAGQLRRV